VKARGLAGKVAIIGFDALPEAIGQVRDGGLTATIEQFPGAQSRKAVDIMVSYLRDNKQPESKLILLTPVAITKANLKEAERLGELK
jgi:inositol transport system substrate-binding protein